MLIPGFFLAFSELEAFSYIFCVNIINKFYSKAFHACSTIFCAFVQINPKDSNIRWKRTPVSKMCQGGFYCRFKLSFAVFFVSCYLEFTICQCSCSSFSHSSGLIYTERNLIYFIKNSVATICRHRTNPCSRQSS